MGNRDRFNRKKKSESAAAPTTKMKFTTPASGLEDVYFTWRTISHSARYVEVVDKLKEYVAVHFRDQATVAARAMEELKPPYSLRLIVPFGCIGLTRVRPTQLTTNVTLDQQWITCPSLRIGSTSLKSKSTSKSTTFTRRGQKLGRRTRANLTTLSFNTVRQN